MFLVNDKLFGEIKQSDEPWNYGACDARAFYAFFQFLKIGNHHFQ